MKSKNKNQSIKVVAVSVLLVWGLPLAVLGLSPDEKESKQTLNKSIIIIDNEEQVAYTKYTDRVNLSEVNKNKLNESKQLTSKIDQLVIEKKMQERYAMLEAKRIAEEKRIAAEKAKKIAAEKAKKAELARVAEEKRKLELAQAKEKKRLADLEAKRVAKTKAKEEAKKNGTKKVVVSRGNSTNSSEAYYEITAYTAGVESTGKRPGDKGYGLTASGARVQQGVTIACPKNFAFGTKVEIEGYGMRVCQDTGSAIGSGKIDLYMESLSAAQQFGRRTLRVKIYN